MAVWSKATLANKVLEYIGVKPIGQSAPSDYSNYVQGVYESVYDRLQDSDLAPYAIGSVPDWAKQPLVEYLAVKVGPRFGKPYPDAMREAAIREMAASRYGGPKSALPIKSQSF